MVVMRKNLAIEQGQARLFDDYRYFFYLTNDRELSAAEIVFAGQRSLQSRELARPAQRRRAGIDCAGR